MKMRSLQFALLALLAPAALAAQGGGGGGGGMSRMANMSPFAMEAPPSADAMTKALGLTADQAAKYSTLREANVAATTPMRAGLDSARTQARAAMQSGDRDKGMEMMRASRPQMESLQKSAEAFDSSVAALLTADQKPKFESWKKQERQKLMEARRSRMGGGGGAPGSR